MKRPCDIDREIRDVANKATDLLDSTSAKTIYAEIQKLKQIKLYVETGPSEVTLKQTLSDAKNKLADIIENFSKWNHSHIRDKSGLLTKYYAEMGVPKIKAQIKTLEFILS